MIQIFNKHAYLVKNDKDVSEYISKYNLSSDKVLDEYKYLTTPTEFQAYIGTNFRDELLNEGYIKSVHDVIPDDIFKGMTKKDLDDLPTLKRYLPFLKNKKSFIKMMNKTPYVLTGATTLYGANKINNK